MKRTLEIAVLSILVSIGVCVHSTYAIGVYGGGGTVLDSVTGAPVPNARVTIVDGAATDCSDYTNSQGKFACTFYLPYATTIVQLTKANYTKANYTIRGGLDGSFYIENPPKNMKPYGWFEGYVKTLQGLAIPGATVSTGTKTTTTDDSGHYKLFVPEDSPYGLSAGKDGCLEQSRVGLAIQAGTATEIDFSIYCF